jgi:hypothetical protein
MNCHCSNCRRATGAAFKPFAGIARDRLGVTRGVDNLTAYGDEANHDAHCGRCGSLLYSVVRDGAFVHVAMGTLIDNPQSARRPTSLSAPRRPGLRSQTTCRNIRNISCHAERPLREAERPLREYVLAAGGLYLFGEPGRKTDRPWANRQGAGPTNEEARVRLTCPWFVT